MAISPTPPGPKGHPIRGNFPEYVADQLGYLEALARDYGDVVRLRFFHIPVYVFNNPQDVEDVLVTKNRSFTKPLDFRLPLFRGIFGNGLLTSDGDFWRRERRLAQPAFHRDRIAEYGKVMVAYTNHVLDSWQDGETRDIHPEMMVLTLRIALKTLFNVEAEDDVAMLSALSNDLIEMFSLQESVLWPVHNYLPTPSSRRFRGLTEQLSQYIYGIISQRRQNSADTGDLLSMLLQAQDDDGSRMTDTQLRDEVMTMFLAGHETTALSLSWTLYLLSQHPEVEAKLAAELDSVLGPREPEVQDLPNLRYTDAVVKESLRLYPPAWAFGRQATEDCEIGNYPVAKGRQVFFFPWVIHRDARYFDSPSEFRPERWADEKMKRIPKYAYLPFGGGPRVCIGNAFAMMEGALVLAAIARRYRVHLAPDQHIVPWPVFTLRPRHGIKMVLEKRPAISRAAIAVLPAIEGRASVKLEVN
jgi:cytochrome P450